MKIDLCSEILIHKEMNKRIFVLTVATLLAVSCGSHRKINKSGAPEPAAGAHAGEPAALASSNNRFALELFREVQKDGENLFFSPYSISSALAMTYAGADGTTEKEMQELLHFPPNTESFHEHYKAFMDSLPARDGKEGIRLNIANALWAQDDYEFRKEFLETVRKYHQAPVKQKNFKDPAARERARQDINRWVEDKTDEKIRNLIGQGVLTELTRLVLTNAIYFNGNWKESFSEKTTREAPFKLPGNREVMADFMHKSMHLPYMENQELQMIGLPYKGGGASMYILLPGQVNGLPDLTGDIDHEKLDRWIDSMQTEYVRVFLPKFSNTSSFSLKKVLKDMGMKTAFETDADFSLMTGENDLLIDEVLHKAYVDVNEKGTEAAAATAVVMALKSALPGEPVEFRADHPFVYLIRENHTGAILFAGQLADPSK